MSSQMLAARLKWKLERVRPRQRILVELFEGLRVGLWTFACGHSPRLAFEMANSYWKLPITVWDNRNVFRFGARRRLEPETFKPRRAGMERNAGRGKR